MSSSQSLPDVKAQEENCESFQTTIAKLKNLPTSIIIIPQVKASSTTCSSSLETASTTTLEEIIIVNSNNEDGQKFNDNVPSPPIRAVTSTTAKPATELCHQGQGNSKQVSTTTIPIVVDCTNNENAPIDEVIQETPATIKKHDHGDDDDNNTNNKFTPSASNRFVIINLSRQDNTTCTSTTGASSSITAIAGIDAILERSSGRTIIDDEISDSGGDDSTAADAVAGFQDDTTTTTNDTVSALSFLSTETNDVPTSWNEIPTAVELKTTIVIDACLDDDDDQDYDEPEEFCPATHGEPVIVVIENEKYDDQTAPQPAKTQAAESSESATESNKKCWASQSFWKDIAVNCFLVVVAVFVLYIGYHAAVASCNMIASLFETAVASYNKIVSLLGETAVASYNKIANLFGMCVDGAVGVFKCGFGLGAIYVTTRLVVKYNNIATLVAKRAVGAVKWAVGVLTSGLSLLLAIVDTLVLNWDRKLDSQDESCIQQQDNRGQSTAARCPALAIATAMESVKSKLKRNGRTSKAIKSYLNQEKIEPDNYETLNVTDLQCLLCDVFAAEVPKRATKKELLDQLIQTYRAELENMDSSSIQQLHPTISASCHHSEAVQKALDAGF